MPTPEFLLPDIDASKRKAVTTAFTNMAKAFGKEPIRQTTTIKSVSLLVVCLLKQAIN